MLHGLQALKFTIKYPHTCTTDESDYNVLYAPSMLDRIRLKTQT